MHKSTENIHHQVDTASGMTKFHPSDIENFLPWAYVKMGVGSTQLLITSIEQSAGGSESVSSRRPQTIRTTEVQTPETITSGIKSETQSKTSYSSSTFEDTIKINCVYSNNQLLKIKLCKNKKIPKCILRLLAIALPFHARLAAFHIDGGLHPSLIFDLGHIVATSNITEVVLDNTYLEDTYVYILLEEDMNLKHLSLARCSINDDMVEVFASKLTYPVPASKQLSVFNLSSNKITDIGAKYLSNALRTNRQLAYLNLSGNMIGDPGAGSILDVLKEFPLTLEEIKDMRVRRLKYLKDEIEFQNKIQDELDRKSLSMKNDNKKKANKPKTNPIDAKDSERTNASASLSAKTAISFDSRQVNIKDTFAQYEDPYRAENITTSDGITHCLGNNTLCYLNLAYNNLNYFSVKKLCHVLNAQRNNTGRKPKGLINVCIEGNNIPDCEELREINVILESGLNGASRLSVSQKRRVFGKFNVK